MKKIRNEKLNQSLSPHQKEVLAYLEQVYYLKQDISKLTKQIEEMADRSVALASPSDCSSVNVQRTPAREACFESRVAEKAEMEEDLRSLTARLEPLEAQAVQLIKTFTWDPHRTAMIWHFIKGFTWESTARRVSYDPRHMFRLRNDALNLITLPDDAIWLD